MAIHLRVDKNNRLIWAELSGTITTNEIFQAITSSIEHPDFEPGFNVISDHTKIEQVITTSQVLDMSFLLQQFSEKMADAKWAVVTTNPASYGMMRMLSVYLEEVPMELRIYKTVAEALAWVRSSWIFPGLVNDENQ